MRVEWSDFARDDLEDLVAYISRDSAFYAQLFGEKVVLEGMIVKYQTKQLVGGLSS